jgi:hypothetical protein
MKTNRQQGAPGRPTGPVKASRGIKTPPVPVNSPVTARDIAKLPLNIRAQIDNGTEIRKRHGLWDNEQERMEEAVRRWRGY